MLALVTDAFGGHGGIAQYNRDLLQAIGAARKQLKLEVYPRVAPGPLEAMAPNLHQHAAVHSRAWYSAQSLAAALRLRPSFVFCGHLYHGSLAALVARAVNAKLISQVHGIEAWGDISAGRRSALEKSDLILAVSRDTRARVLGKIDIAPERVIVINNTVGDAFRPGDRANARRRFGLDDSIVVLTVGRLDAREKYKGHDRVIGEIARNSAAGRKLVYLIAGKGNDRARLESLAREQSVESQVRFLDYVPSEDLPDLYRAADLFALPSTGEGFGIAFLEAMACGTPAIGLAVGGARDALGDGDLGVSVAPEDFPDAFARALATPRPSGLAVSVRSRYGVAAYQARVGRILQLIEELSPRSAMRH